MHNDVMRSLPSILLLLANKLSDSQESRLHVCGVLQMSLLAWRFETPLSQTLLFPVHFLLYENFQQIKRQSRSNPGIASKEKLEFNVRFKLVVFILPIMFSGILLTMILLGAFGAFTMAGPVSPQEGLKPTIFFVQGAFQLPGPYQAFEKLFWDDGYTVDHPVLASCSDPYRENFTQVSLKDDVQIVQSRLEDLVINNGKTVIVIMHSYGGLVGNSAIPEELSRSWRSSHKMSGGIAHLFMYSAFVLPVNQSVIGAFGVSPDVQVQVRVSAHFRSYPTDISSLVPCRMAELTPRTAQDRFTVIYRQLHKKYTPRNRYHYHLKFGTTKCLVPPTNTSTRRTSLAKATSPCHQKSSKCLPKQRGQTCRLVQPGTQPSSVSRRCSWLGFLTCPAILRPEALSTEEKIGLSGKEAGFTFPFEPKSEDCVHVCQSRYELHSDFEVEMEESVNLILRCETK